MLLIFLQVSVSLIFFTNKVLLLAGKKKRKDAWFVGSLACILSILYFFLIELIIYTVMEFGAFVLMFYGCLPEKRKKKKTELMINLFLIVILSLFTFFVFSGILTVVEFVSAVLFITGTYFFTHEKISLGWSLFAVTHLGSAMLGISKGEDFFTIFQIASSLIALIGLFQIKFLRSSL